MLKTDFRFGGFLTKMKASWTSHFQTEGINNNSYRDRVLQ